MKTNKIPQAAELASAPVQGRPNPTRRILVVECEPDFRRLDAEVLMSSGYEVDVAEDGDAGWEMLHTVNYTRESYDLLFIDLDMPGLSGLALDEEAARRPHSPAGHRSHRYLNNEGITHSIPLAPARGCVAQALYHRGVVGNGARNSARARRCRREDCAAKPARAATSRWFAATNKSHFAVQCSSRSHPWY